MVITTLSTSHEQRWFTTLLTWRKVETGYPGVLILWSTTHKERYWIYELFAWIQQLPFFRNQEENDIGHWKQFRKLDTKKKRSVQTWLPEIWLVCQAAHRQISGVGVTDNPKFRPLGLGNLLIRIYQNKHHCLLNKNISYVIFLFWSWHFTRANETGICWKAFFLTSDEHNTKENKSFKAYGALIKGAHHPHKLHIMRTSMCIMAGVVILSYSNIDHRISGTFLLHLRKRPFSKPDTRCMK